MFKCDICFLASFVAHPVMSAQAIVVSADYDIGSPQTRHYSHNGNKHWKTFECTRNLLVWGSIDRLFNNIFFLKRSWSNNFFSPECLY